MITFDIGVIIATLLAILIGSIVGFGKGLKFFTKGIFGKIITVVICYFLFGIVLSWPFVQDLIAKFINMLAEKDSWILNLLIKIRIDLVAFAIVLFIVVSLLKKIVVSLIAGLFEADNCVMRVINKVLGVILFVAMFIVLALIVFQVSSWIEGENGQIFAMLQDSKLKLDVIYLNNPLKSIIENITGSILQK